MKTYNSLQLYKKSLQDLWDYKGSFFLYQIFSKTITALLLLPLMSVVFNNLMQKSGYSVLTNGSIANFFLSAKGFLALLIILFLSILVVLLELGGVIIISANAYFKRPVSVIQVFRSSLSRIKNMLGVGSLFILLFFLVISPWLGFNLGTSLIPSLKIPGFIMDTITNNGFLYTMTNIGIAIFFIVGVFLMFSLHSIILNNKSSFASIKESIRIVRNNIVHLAGFVILMLALNIIVLLVVGVIALIVMFVIFKFLSGATGVVLGFLVLMNTIIITIGIASLVLTPLLIHQLTYYYFNIQDQGIPTDIVGNLRMEKPPKKSKLLFFVGGIGGIVIALFISMTFLLYYAGGYYNVEITAHRGNSVEAPENTMAALKKAIDSGAEYAEIDVQLTKDQKVILTHDTNLKRVTGEDINIYDLTLEEAQKLDAGSWFGEEFKGERLPSLQEVIDLTKNKIKLNIELKSHDYSDNLVKETVKLLKENYMMNHCVVTSLEYPLLEEVEDIAPRIRTGYVMYVAIGDLSSINTDFYSIEASRLTTKFVDAAHAINREVHVWTVNNMGDLQGVLDTGVDNVITDYVEASKEEIKVLNEDKMFFYDILREIIGE